MKRGNANLCTRLFGALKAVLAAEELVEGHCGIRFAYNGLGAIDKEDDLIFELDLRGCGLRGSWQRLRLRGSRDRRRMREEEERRRLDGIVEVGKARDESERRV